jgi:uncharacterized protein (DUF2235 family)
MPETGKNIAVFCDGTWQNLDQRYPTNVAILARAVRPDTVGGDVQFVYYDDGVGVSQGVADTLTRLIGGATGKGLDHKIARAYEFLCLNYNPGDRIFIFGFSRGAYTARSLAGLLRLVWILRRENASLVHEVTAHYRTRPKQGASQAAQASFQATVDKFRADYCHPEKPFVDDKAYDPADSNSLAPASNCAWIQYLGVWDTVGSLGVPRNVPFASLWDAKYQFHDTSLSRFVRSARHAVSIDERRDTFAPTLWDNIGALNENAHASELAYTNRPYQQVWFPGGHGCVGGGSDDGGVSLPALLWIAEGAARAGLAFDDQKLNFYGQQARPDAKFQEDGFGLGDLLTKLSGLSDRKGPDIPDEVSLSAQLRWARLPTYRPTPLSRLAGDLDKWQPPAEPHVYYAP